MSKIKNELGNIYGKLTVINQKPSSNGKAMWECICECGNTTIKSGKDLRSGRIVGCGKCKNYKNEVGNRYGKLLVLEKVDNGKDGIIWKCQCDCGNITVASGHLLRSGDKQSCGCLIKVNEKIGTRYGSLVILQEGGRTNQGTVKWVCQCDCGRQIEVDGASLRTGNTKSCGCTKSWGEKIIAEFLNNHNISFVTQYKIFSCRDKRPLPFDFAISNNDYIILLEFDGIQHFKFINSFGQSYEEWLVQLKHDKIKNDYCSLHSNSYHLYRIKYDDDIELKLKDILAKEGLL